MGRYEEISMLLQNELGYKLLWQGTDSYGQQAWKFIKNGITHDLNEKTIYTFFTFENTRYKEVLKNAENILTENILLSQGIKFWD
jgi:hypothetical protein